MERLRPFGGLRGGGHRGLSSPFVHHFALGALRWRGDVREGTKREEPGLACAPLTVIVSRPVAQMWLFPYHGDTKA
jgi:hypothetical protein